MSLQVAPFQNVCVLRAFSLLPAKGETTTFHCFLQHFAVFFLASRFPLVMKIKVPRVPNVNVLAPSVPIASVWAPTHTHKHTHTHRRICMCVLYGCLLWGREKLVFLFELRICAPFQHSAFYLLQIALHFGPVLLLCNFAFLFLFFVLLCLMRCWQFVGYKNYNAPAPPPTSEQWNIVINFSANGQTDGNFCLHEAATGYTAASINFF